MTEAYNLPLAQKTEQRRRRRLIILIILCFTGALLLGVAIWGGISYVIGYMDKKAKRCDGLDSTSGSGYNLFRSADRSECIGWTIERDYAFGSTDRDMAKIISKIITENRRVAGIEPAGRAGPYVRVAVMTPMTSTEKENKEIVAESIRHALEGAYAAQRYANNEGPDNPLGDKNLQIQLVLANSGSYQSLWPDVVSGLGKLRDGEHPLVAVTGLDASVQNTRAAAAELNKVWALPSIGGVLTADDMTTRGMPGQPTIPGLFKVSSSNHQYTLALKHALDAGPRIKKGFLAWDRNDDNFVQSLSAAFKQTFDDTFHLSQHASAFTGSKPPIIGFATLFREIARDISAEKPDVVFYAGRSRDFPLFIRALKNRPHEGPLSPIVIATVSTGPVVRDDQKEGVGNEPLTQEDLNAANVGILDASTTDPVAWAQKSGTPPHYEAFHKFFTGHEKGELGYSETDLTDGYAIMHYDAVAVAVRAARDVFADKIDNNPTTTTASAQLPNSADVRNAIGSSRNNLFPGASGDFYFEEQQQPNDLWPIGKQFLLSDSAPFSPRRLGSNPSLTRQNVRHLPFPNNLATFKPSRAQTDSRTYGLLRTSGVAAAR